MAGMSTAVPQDGQGAGRPASDSGAARACWQTEQTTRMGMSSHPQGWTHPIKRRGRLPSSNPTLKKALLGGRESWEFWRLAGNKTRSQIVYTVLSVLLYEDGCLRKFGDAGWLEDGG